MTVRPGEDDTEEDDGAWEAAATLLWDWMNAQEIAELDRPHVVVVLDDASPGHVRAIGPFPTALAAATAAERESLATRRDDPSNSVRYQVYALEPLPGGATVGK